MPKSVIATGNEVSFPCGFTTTDNRLEDHLQKLLSPAAYSVYRQYLRYWGGDKTCAFPSLSTTAEKTGMSEKTIRKCNTELQDKGFIKYMTGGPNYSNRYYFIEIDDIMIRHYGQPIINKPEHQKVAIKEIDSKNEKNTKKLIDSIDKKFIKRIKSFIEIFLNAYADKMGVEYKLDYHDAKSLSQQSSFIFDNFDLYIKLIQTYFKTDNKFVVSSDYSLHFMLNDKVKRALVSEHGQTNEGRWIAQAESEWKKLEKHLKPNMDIESTIKEKIKFPAASSERDLFIYNYLFKKAQGYLEG